MYKHTQHLSFAGAAAFGALLCFSAAAPSARSAPLEQAASPWHIMLLIGVQPAPDQPATLIGTATIKDGYATEAKCNSEVEKPSFTKVIAKMQRDVSKKVGLSIAIVPGCIDVTRLSAPGTPRKKIEGEESL